MNEKKEILRVEVDEKWTFVKYEFSSWVHVLRHGEDIGTINMGNAVSALLYEFVELKEKFAELQS